MSKSCRKRPVTWFVLTTLLIFVVTGVVLAKNPHQPPPSQSPVRYQIRLFTVPVEGADFGGVYDMNNWGQIVGHYHNADGGIRPFLFDPARDNADDAIGAARDLNDIETLPADWLIRGAMGINDRGDIAAYVLFEDEVYGVRRHLCIIKTMDEPPHRLDTPQIYVIPDSLFPQGYLATWANAINNNGDVMGTYRDLDGGTHNFVCGSRWYTDEGSWYYVPVPELPGNAIRVISDVQFDEYGEIVTAPMIVGEDSLGLGAFRCTLGTDDLEHFPWGPAVSWKNNFTGGTVTVMNSKGTFGGECWLQASDGKLEYAPFLVRADGTWRQLEEGVTRTRYANISSPAAINANEDVILSHFATYGSSLSLHHADLHDGFEALELNDLLVATRSNVINASSDLQVWQDSLRSVREMNDRAIVTNTEDVSELHFGQIAGDLALVDSKPGSGSIVGHLGFLLTPIASP